MNKRTRVTTVRREIAGHYVASMLLLGACMWSFWVGLALLAIYAVVKLAVGG